MAKQHQWQLGDRCRFVGWPTHGTVIGFTPTDRVIVRWDDRDYTPQPSYKPNSESLLYVGPGKP